MNKADLVRYFKLHKVFLPFYSGIGHVLMFHRVCNDNESVLNKNLQVTSEYLERVVQYFISCNIDIVTLDECYNRLISKGNVKRFAVFTFDDGYADNLTNALPVFEKYNAPFAVFLATGFPDQKVALLWYLLEELVINNNLIDFNEGGKNFHFKTMTLNEKKEAYYKIRYFIRMSNQSEMITRIMNICQKDYDEVFELNRRLMLSWEQIKQLGNHPLVTLGAHTVNHQALSTLEEHSVMAEIKESIIRIEENTGTIVKYLAYPYGGIKEANTREFNLADKCKIRLAFTAINGNLFKKHAHHLTSLPRIGLNENWTISHIDLYINGLTPFLDRLR